ncbi:glycosyltransferase [Abyssalbus ytuae]|uniref:Glycosyltransferase n=1 Tax=Abyssalbus ytuae TaxID=2926907 RepID=A0A9E6ZZZ9_9FLAO|nr:glycosyltransferase [Abyssalbus ytuae]UOB17076.1 glycosyltransferase [Abyssalbus ytuae]
MKLSVIVPVYNLAEYLEKCINSIVQQDIPPANYEIVAVNDGSTDNSLQILDSLSSKYKNLKIISQENKGLSSARNTGIEHATGEYILFVDSDDYILPGTLHHLLSIARKNTLDVLEFGAAGIDQNGKIVYSIQKSTNNGILSGEEYLSSVTYMNSACNKLYRREFFNKHSFRFKEGIYIEDIEFNIRVIFYAKRVQAIDRVMAHFVQREGSITRTRNFAKTKKMVYNILTVITSLNNFSEVIITPKSKAYIAVKKKICGLITTMLLRVVKSIDDYTIKTDIISQLKKQNLYPIPYKTGEKKKDIFRWFANQNYLFSMICKINCSINKKR